MTGLVSLTKFAQGLMADVRAHREGKLATREARVRAMLAREALRAKDIGSGAALPAPRRKRGEARP